MITSYIYLDISLWYFVWDFKYSCLYLSLSSLNIRVSWFTYECVNCRLCILHIYKFILLCVCVCVPFVQTLYYMLKKHKLSSYLRFVSSFGELENKTKNKQIREKKYINKRENLIFFVIYFFSFHIYIAYIYYLKQLFSIVGWSSIVYSLCVVYINILFYFVFEEIEFSIFLIQ